MDPELMDAVRSAFARSERTPVAVYLFGSVARGTDTADSDIDIGVVYSDGAVATLESLPFDVEDDLTASLNKRVQIVVLDDAPPDLIHRVLREGCLVVDNDRSARIRFEVRARNEYFDLKPYLDRYRCAVAR